MGHPFVHDSTGENKYRGLSTAQGTMRLFPASVEMTFLTYFLLTQEHAFRPG
jgi:hypothetical protein